MTPSLDLRRRFFKVHAFQSVKCKFHCCVWLGCLFVSQSDSKPKIKIESSWTARCIVQNYERQPQNPWMLRFCWLRASGASLLPTSSCNLKGMALARGVVAAS